MQKFSPTSNVIPLVNISSSSHRLKFLLKSMLSNSDASSQQYMYEYRIHSNSNALGVSKTWSWCINDGLKIWPPIHAFFMQKSLISPFFVSHEHGRLFEWIRYMLARYCSLSLISMQSFSVGGLLIWRWVLLYPNVNLILHRVKSDLKLTILSKYGVFLPYCRGNTCSTK